MHLLTQCEQWRSGTMVSFSYVCLRLHSLLGPTFECSLKSTSTIFLSKKCRYLSKTRPKRQRNHVSSNSSFSQKCLYPSKKKGQKRQRNHVSSNSTWSVKIYNYGQFVVCLSVSPFSFGSHIRMPPYFLSKVPLPFPNNYNLRQQTTTQAIWSYVSLSLSLSLSAKKVAFMLWLGRMSYGQHISTRVGCILCFWLPSESSEIRQKAYFLMHTLPHLNKHVGGNSV